MYQSCGSGATQTGNYRCSGNLLQKETLTKGCANNACFSNSTWQTQQDCAASSKVCQNNQCINNCAPTHDTKKCVGSSVYWYDNCNAKNDLYQDCSLTNQICQNGQCVDTACKNSTECGTNGFINGPFCKSDGNVYKTYRTFTCNNPNTANATCTHADADQLQTTCATGQTCSNGSCTNNCLPSHSTKKCDGNNSVYWYDNCNAKNDLYQDCSLTNQTCQDGQCVTINCSHDSDCTGGGIFGDPFCSNGSIYKNSKSFVCKNPGQTNSYCDPTITQVLQNTCSSDQTCNNGTCTNNTSNISVSCYATPSSINVNQSATFIAAATGGTGYYSYVWSGACTGSTASTCTNTFNTNGTQTASVVVTSGTQNNSTTCNVVVNPNTTPTCTQSPYQRCNGNYLYSYDSCGNQTSQYCPQGCYNNSCNYYVQQNGYLTLTKTVRNLTTGSGWANSVYASPSDVVMFMVTLQANNGQSMQNVYVRDSLPSNLIYNNQLVFSGSNGYYNNYSGDVISGLNINSIASGQTVTITYQAQVAGSQNFAYGTTTLVNNVSVTSSNSSNTPNASASVVVTRGAVLGASTVSTGLTNNFWLDSFFLPLLITIVLLWMWKSGFFFSLEKWISDKKSARNNHSSEKELQNRIALIKKGENI